jgi:hypothetical protein
VILRFSQSLNVSLSSGLTYAASTIGGDTLITITAGTGTVTWS